MDETIQRVEASQRLAWSLKEAPKILGLSRTSFYRERARRKIFLTFTHKLLSREEALRYLRDEIQIARRLVLKKRINRPTTPA